ncbi:MAG: glutathione peroxidase [Flavitalea sp.]
MKSRRLKRLVVVILLLATSCWIYVDVVNRNSQNMTVRQKVLKAIYPLFTSINRLLGKSSRIIQNENNIKPIQSFYDLTVSLNDGSKLSLKQFKGKKVMLVNSASDCGYTGQYVELQKLYRDYKDNLMIIGFPANDFKQQEKNSDEDIEKFCIYNYGVSFPLAKKSVVIQSSEQNEVFRWLSDHSKNGWNDQPPSWNFSKYMINEEGVLTHYFDPAISPLSDEVLQALRN